MRLMKPAGTQKMQVIDVADYIGDSYYFTNNIIENCTLNGTNFKKRLNGTGDLDQLMDKLFSLGNVDGIGRLLKPTKLIQQYGFDYLDNPRFKRLPIEKQKQLIMTNWKQTMPNHPLRTNSYYLFGGKNGSRNDKQKAKIINKTIDEVKGPAYVYNHQHWCYIEAGQRHDLNYVIRKTQI